MGFRSKKPVSGGGKNQHPGYKERKDTGEYINPGRPAYVDMMMEEADKHPEDIELQKKMINGNTPYLTRKERSRIKARIKRAEGGWRRSRTKVGKMAREIERLAEEY